MMGINMPFEVMEAVDAPVMATLVQVSACCAAHHEPYRICDERSHQELAVWPS